MTEELQIRTYGDPNLPALVYLPGLHGDWTLITAFRLALADRLHFVEVTYPRSLAWSVEDYANAIANSLLARGLDRGWLLGESFGSQIAWALSEKQSRPREGADKGVFQVEGLILAGGFVKHPWRLGPTALWWVGRLTPAPLYRIALKTHAWGLKFRYRLQPAVLDSLNEFLERRTELDRRVMGYRLKLLDQYDPRPIAQRTKTPVYYLAGLVDPLVPWVRVRWWLRNNCPGYRTGKTFWLADHNVLATAAEGSAETVVNWITSSPPLNAN